MMPALGRGVGFLWFVLQMPFYGLMFPGYITQALIITMVLLGAWKFDKLRHPATYLALGVNLFVLLTEPIGRSAAVAAFLDTAVKN